MNLSQSFITDAMRTNNPLAGNYGTAVERQVIHALLGVVDETHELLMASDGVNMMEELGDLRWFLALYQQTTGVILPIEGAQADLGEIDNWTHKLVSIAKRMFAYGEPLSKHSVDINAALCGLTATLTHLVNNHFGAPATLPAESAVINKLRARFPEKFTQQHASNRDLGYERETLERSLNRSEPSLRTTGVNESVYVPTCDSSPVSNYSACDSSYSSSDSGSSGGSSGSCD